MQLELYMHINREKLVYEEDKVLFATSYLTGAAFDWFKPIIWDYQDHQYNKQDKETKEIFSDFQQFKRHLQGTFGDINTEWNAKQRLKQLWQMKSAQSYSSEFLQISSHTSWDNNMLMTFYEDGLKTEIQEKLIWMEWPKTLSKYIELAVKIDNKLYDFNIRKRGHQFWKEPWMSNYQANDRRPFQQHNQPRYEDPYGLQPMELDTMQQWQGLLSTQEKEWQWHEKLCFICGRSGHMLKDCQQSKERSLRQQWNTTYGNGHAQLNATQDREAYDTTGMVKTTELRADDDYQAMQETYSEHNDPVMVPNITPMRTMMQNNTSLTDEEIEEIMSSSYENLRQPARADTGIHTSEESDKTEVVTHQEPVQRLSPDNQADKDWQGIDTLDKEYSIQWNGHEPNMEGLLEVLDTPQIKNTIPIWDNNESEESATEAGSQSTKEISSETLEAVLFAANIVRSIQEKLTRFSHKVRQLCYDLSNYCPHQSLGCWEWETTSWDEHLQRCPNHPTFCGICHQRNTQDWIHLQQVTNKQKWDNNHEPCYSQQCDCIHYDDHLKHNEIPWIACYTDDCDEHFNKKAVAQHWPKWLQKTVPICPCNDHRCACSRYPRHPYHTVMHWTKCFNLGCLIHKSSIKEFCPSPRMYRVPN